MGLHVYIIILPSTSRFLKQSPPWGFPTNTVCIYMSHMRPANIRSPSHHSLFYRSWNIPHKVWPGLGQPQWVFCAPLCRVTAYCWRRGWVCTVRDNWQPQTGRDMARHQVTSHVPQHANCYPVDRPTSSTRAVPFRSASLYCTSVLYFNHSRK